ncbi:hypothetical protein HGM15179_012369 [Zosterops borbonicus]|uniref:Uncharacterized protein n=1 Tax=Zosterops borbonicus TaxID=364589 RepID=A0A8K1LI17_9PASS|nr:hypothetical protein HGM15179_012369 [Zosterops borbonicus]
MREIKGWNSGGELQLGFIKLTQLPYTQESARRSPLNSWVFTLNMGMGKQEGYNLGPIQNGKGVTLTLNDNPKNDSRNKKGKENRDLPNQSTASLELSRLQGGLQSDGQDPDVTYMMID